MGTPQGTRIKLKYRQPFIYHKFTHKIQVTPPHQFIEGLSSNAKPFLFLLYSQNGGTMAAAKIRCLYP
jgi:hypothetical protein